jgi:hypothetical protein
VVNNGIFFANLGYFSGFSIYTNNFAGRNSETAIGGAGHITFRVPGSSLRVRRISVVCDVAQKGAA